MIIPHKPTAKDGTNCEFKSLRRQIIGVNVAEKPVPSSVTIGIPVFLKKVDPWDLNSLQALCQNCHILKSKSEARKPPKPGKAAWKSFLNRKYAISSM